MQPNSSFHLSPTTPPQLSTNSPLFRPSNMEAVLNFVPSPQSRSSVSYTNSELSTDITGVRADQESCDGGFDPLVNKG